MRHSAKRVNELLPDEERVEPPATLPQEWANLTDHLRTALLEGQVLRLQHLTQSGSDNAMQRYIKAVDAVIASLGRLSEAGLLDEFGAVIARRAKAATEGSPDDQGSADLVQTAKRPRRPG